MLHVYVYNFVPWFLNSFYIISIFPWYYIISIYMIFKDYLRNSIVEKKKPSILIYKYFLPICSLSFLLTVPSAVQKCFIW